jgi:CRISPR type I-F-associated protein Csy1
MSEILRSWIDKRNESAAKQNKKLLDDGKEPTNNENQTIGLIIHEAAKKEGRVTYVTTHEPKMSCPTAPRLGGIIANSEFKNDGLIRSGSVDVEVDLTHNASDTAVCNLMLLKLEDGKSVFWHISNRTPLVMDALRNNGVEIVDADYVVRTMRKQVTDTNTGIRQVYFPESGDYTLLSVVQPTSLAYEQSSRIKDLNFRESSKEPRKARREGKMSKDGYSELLDLVLIGHGGSTPRNLGALSKRERGKVMCFMSIPPAISPRKVKFPRVDFFSYGERVIDVWALKSLFRQFHQNLDTTKNNIDIRERRDELIRTISDVVFNLVWAIRCQEVGWSKRDYYDCLKPHHKIILDDVWASDRSDAAHKEAFMADMASWFMQTYKIIMSDRALDFDEEDERHVLSIMEEERAL